MSDPGHGKSFSENGGEPSEAEVVPIAGQFPRSQRVVPGGLHCPVTSFCSPTYFLTGFCKPLFVLHALYSSHVGRSHVPPIVSKSNRRVFHSSKVRC